MVRNSLFLGSCVVMSMLQVACMAETSDEDGVDKYEAADNSGACKGETKFSSLKAKLRCEGSRKTPRMIKFQILTNKNGEKGTWTAAKKINCDQEEWTNYNFTKTVTANDEYQYILPSVSGSSLKEFHQADCDSSDGAQETIDYGNGQSLNFVYHCGCSNPISFRTAHGNYLAAEENGGGAVNANRIAIGPWEKFHLVPDGPAKDGAQISIQTGNGHFFSAQPQGGLDANRSAIGPWERFTLINHSARGGYLEPGHVVSLKSAHDKYVGAEDTGKANANRGAIGPWEKFVVLVD